MSPAPNPTGFDPVHQLAIIQKAMAKQSFCVLATSSAQNRPHAVGLLYAAVGLDVYILVGENTIKVRNIRANPSVAVSIPVRKYPVGPPMAVQFQGTAEVLPPEDPHIKELLAARRLKRIVGLGAADHPGNCFVKISPRRRISSYGLGISLIKLIRDVTQGHRTVQLP